MRIFLIEDDKALAEGISFTFKKKDMRQRFILPAEKAGRRWITVSRIWYFWIGIYRMATGLYFAGKSLKNGRCRF